MLAIVNTPGGPEPVAIREVPEPEARPHEALLAVQLAARSGARVTAIVGSAERARILDGLGAAEIVTRIEDAEGRFALILESAGGASLKAAMERIEHRGTVVIFGNSSGEPTEINFRDFAEHQNARIQGFHYFTSEPEERFGPDLALLAGLIAYGSLRPRIDEHDWRDLARIGPLLRERRIPGKAVGLELDRVKEGMGIRSQRYAMLVENGVVKALNVEKPGEYAVSSAEAMLEKL